MQNSLIKKFKRLFSPLKHTIAHPQWLSFRQEDILLKWLSNISQHSIVLDIGCANRWPEKFLPKECLYFGLDYLDTSSQMYQSNVDLYADAQSLPFADNSVDVIILFDVLEHISDFNQALREIARTIKPNGLILGQIPFIYPIHDTPYDYTRLTKFGLVNYATKNGLLTEFIESRGKPLESALLLVNISLAKTIINNIENRNFFVVLITPIIFILIMLINCLGWLVSKFFNLDDFMPFSYHFILRKQI